MITYGVVADRLPRLPTLPKWDFKKQKKMKKREGFKVIIPKKQRKRIAKDQCPSCGKHKNNWPKGRRKDFRCCCPDCTSEFWRHYISYGWQDFRKKALRRDNYACIKCGDNRETVYREVWQNTILNLEEIQTNPHAKPQEGKKKVKKPYPNLYVDHIIPIALGGGEWDLNNLQTLCKKHNDKKTKEDLRKIAKQRRIEKENEEA